VTDSPASLEVVVVVPTKNSAVTLRSCLQSIRAQSVQCTLVVVDNNSTDTTALIANEFADLVLYAGPERSTQRNVGARSVSSPIVGFIDSDMILSRDVVKQAVAAIESGATSIVVPETTVGDGYWARVSAFERSFYEGSRTVEAPRFFTTDAFRAIGGFDEEMTGAEDWDIGLRSEASGPRFRIDARIIHEEGHVNYFALCRKKAYYAPGVALFVRKHGASALIGMSRRPWLRQPRALMNALGLGLVVLKVGEAISMVTSVALSSFGHRVGLSRSEGRRR
jgi:glycosyltransferase involved in cell wall biosynthesis